MARNKYAAPMDDLSPKYDQAQALVRVVAREWVGYPAGEVYQQLEKQGWVWTGGGWYPQKDIMEWSTGQIEPREGETLYFLPGIGVNVAVKVAVKPKEKN